MLARCSVQTGNLCHSHETTSAAARFGDLDVQPDFNAASVPMERVGLIEPKLEGPDPQLNNIRVPAGAFAG